MKKEEQNIRALVEETLKAFDGIKRVKPNPFLFTRLQARMEAEKESETKFKTLSPVFQQIAIALVILVFIVNIITMARLLIIPSTSASMQTEEQAFIEEFYPSTPTLYNINQTIANP